MNILSINSFNFDLKASKRNLMSSPNNTSSYNLKLAAPLESDTVSFRAKAAPKMLKSRTNGTNQLTARQVYEICEKKQGEIQNFIKGLFSKYLVTEAKPNNLIEYVSGRAKKPGSIVEKSCVLGIQSKNDILHKMTDLNATKAVILDASRKNVHKTLDILLEKIKEGLIILEEVEVKRPIAAKNLKGKDKFKYDYAAPDKMEKFVEDAEAAMGKKVNFLEADYTKANYTAIHFLLRLPGQDRVFEFQLMGHNVAKFKDLDDILFKVLNNKNVDEKYQPIIDLLKPISLSNDEKDLYKSIKIKKEIKKLLPEERAVLLERISLDNDLINDADSPEFVAKIKNMLKSKDFSKEDLPLVLESQSGQEFMSEKEIADLELKVKRHKKFSEYRAKAFLFQREKKYTDKNSLEYFLPLSEDLPAELDLNNLYKVYQNCNK